MTDAFSALRRFAARLVRHRPTIEPQLEPADCGYVCAVALLHIGGGSRWSVRQVKEAAGRTSRGLTLRQLRDVLRTCGMAAEAIAFDTQRAGAYPCPGVVLLKHGHYVAVVDRSADRFEIYVPSYGWSWVSWR